MLVQYSLHINFSMCYSLQQTSCSTKHTKTSSTFYIAKGKLLVTFRLRTALRISSVILTSHLLKRSLMENFIFCVVRNLNLLFSIDLFSETRWLYFRTGFTSQVSLSCNWAIFNKITKRSPDGNSQSLSYNIYRSQVFFFTSQILVAS